MSILWAPNEKYDASKPQSWRNMPYKRLYQNLTPEELAELLQDAKRLRWQVLNLSRCGLSALPDTLGELEDLRNLNIGNGIVSIYGDENAFTKLPDCVTRLTSLQSLDLSGTEISALPDSMGNLTSLKSLNLSGTPISALPDCVTRLTSLQSLSLSGTPISALPDSMGNLTSLQSLDLSLTEISALPDCVTRLTSLQSLSLSRTEISAWPDSMENLKNLKSLNLSGCHLREIPYSVVALGLPFVIDDWLADNCVNLTGVTLDEGDLQLFEQGRDVIEAHYRGKTQILKECKVIFLGDGAAGKSSLIERMVNGNFEEHSLPTDGVNMTKWRMEIKGEPFTLRVLDFGGQEIMHSMHRCFLTGHTVYVIVCESRNDVEIDGVAARWLETVRSFAPDCPVILALNKADLNQNVSVNETDLRKRNAQLRHVLKTSAKEAPEHTLYGVNRLQAAIQELIPECVNEYPFNVDMLGVKQKLENLQEEKKDYISSDEYRKICADNHIADAKLQYGLLGYFRDLGVAYFYESGDLDHNLESVRVLNPEWLTNGIYRLILRTKESGFLTIKEIEKTLRATYPGDIHREISYTPLETEFVLHVMRNFQISHYIGNGTEMLPLKLPKTPPEIVETFPRREALHLRWEGDYLPNNLIHRLLIQKFDELDIERVWRTGGWFRQEGGECEALAEMNEKGFDLYVHGGRDCREYLNTFRHKIQRILFDMNLKPSEKICRIAENGVEGRLSYRDVVRMYHDGKGNAEILIPGTGTYVTPIELLRETYINWKQEAEPPPVQSRPKEEKAKETSKEEPGEKPLETEKIRAEIEQLYSETLKNHLWAIFFFFVLILILIFAAAGKLDKVWELLPALSG